MKFRKTFPGGSGREAGGGELSGAGLAHAKALG